MNDAQAIEALRKQYCNQVVDCEISTEKVSLDTLDRLLRHCDENKHIEKRVEWYDDEGCPERLNWIDVEGEGYGWLWSKFSDDESKWHGLIRDSMLEYKEKKESRLGESEEQVVI